MFIVMIQCSEYRRGPRRRDAHFARFRKTGKRHMPLCVFAKCGQCPKITKHDYFLCINQPMRLINFWKLNDCLFIETNISWNLFIL